MEIHYVYSEHTEYGECRCCMAKGQHRDVRKEYYYNNIREVYIDIFMDCFSLALSTDSHISPLICSNCVQRLRDATSFRMMVVGTERQLLSTHLSNKDDTDTLFVDVPVPSPEPTFTKEIKTEFEDVFEDGRETASVEGFKGMHYITKAIKGNSNVQLDNIEFNFENYECDSVSIKEDNPEATDVKELKLLSRFPTVRPLPTRSQLYKICPEFYDHLRKLKDKIVKPRSLEWFFRKPRPDENVVSEKVALAINATTIFENSNAVAFKTKMRNGYPCFYCRQIYLCDTLRTHQISHSKANIYKLLTKYTADELIVYADITHLKCTICNENMKNLKELKIHLIERHEKNFFLKYPDRVIPFKLKESDFECQDCGVRFETFGAVERHMNTHYGNYICEECGAGFVTKHRLGIHSYSLHKSNNVNCNICKKQFRSQLKFKIHYDAVHRLLKKYKCSKCPEKFIDYFTRQKHLVDVHGVEPILYKCNVCEKGFNRKFSLSLHVKRCHLDQRDIKCQYCSYTCFRNTELKEHMVKHNGQKPYICCVCKKAYGRNRALILHMKIHNNDRRFSCNVCGIAFVQRATLKGHMKTHHLEQN